MHLETTNLADLEILHHLVKTSDKSKCKVSKDKTRIKQLLDSKK